MNAGLVAIAAFALSYLVGQISYGLGQYLSGKFSIVDRSHRDIAQMFLVRCPAAEGRPFLSAHIFDLHTGIEVQNMELASEIASIRTAGLMLRSTAPALILATAVSLAEVFFGHAVQALVTAALLGLASFFALRASQVRARWFQWKVLQAAFWLPELDEALDVDS